MRVFYNGNRLILRGIKVKGNGNYLKEMDSLNMSIESLNSAFDKLLCFQITAFSDHHKL